MLPASYSIVSSSSISSSFIDSMAFYFELVIEADNDWVDKLALLSL